MQQKTQTSGRSLDPTGMPGSILNTIWIHAQVPVGADGKPQTRSATRVYHHGPAHPKITQMRMPGLRGFTPSWIECGMTTGNASFEPLPWQPVMSKKTVYVYLTVTGSWGGS